MSPSPQHQRVSDLYSQKQRCKLNKSNISLTALFSHSVSLDWITFVDAAVCTGEFCHLPKPPPPLVIIVSVSHSLHSRPLCLPLTGGFGLCVHRPRANPFLTDFVLLDFFVCVWFSFIFVKDTPCNKKSAVGLGNILTALLRRADFETGLHRCHSLVIHLF